MAARVNDLPVAPIGDAWQFALAQNPSLDLWSSDSKHPNLQGSDLTAVTLWHELATHVNAPQCQLGTQASSFTADLDSTQAAALQRAGASAVQP